MYWHESCGEAQKDQLEFEREMKKKEIELHALKQRTLQLRIQLAEVKKGSGSVTEKWRIGMSPRKVPGLS